MALFQVDLPLNVPIEHANMFHGYVKLPKGSRVAGTTFFALSLSLYFQVYSLIRDAKKAGLWVSMTLEHLATLHCPGAGLRPNQGAFACQQDNISLY